ncbi:transcriptional regulator, partial [Shigella sonnei]
QCSPTWLLFGDEDKQPGEPIPDNQPAILTEDQKELLQLFDALPESEQKALLSEMRARVENFNKLFEELLKARKRSANK